MNKEKVTAIILAAGQGRRMNQPIQKQYLKLNNQPIMSYALQTFQECQEIDDIILVVSPGEVAFCKENIVEAYGISKVVKIIEGGKERYHSVYNALESIKDNFTSYVLIHDSARPLIRKYVIEKSIKEVKSYQACTIGVPVKDTIKIVDEEGIIIETPNRNSLWSIQTPQIFRYHILKEAYDRFMANQTMIITDDASIIEAFTELKVKVIKGDYDNIKITTPEDILLAQTLLLGEKN